MLVATSTGPAHLKNRSKEGNSVWLNQNVLLDDAVAEALAEALAGLDDLELAELVDLRQHCVVRDPTGVDKCVTSSQSFCRSETEGGMR